LHKSWLGYALAAAYIAFAIPFIHRALHATGGWISLKGLDIAIATIPSSFHVRAAARNAGLATELLRHGIAGVPRNLVSRPRDGRGRLRDRLRDRMVFRRVFQ
jgi:hypothetical protein